MATTAKTIGIRMDATLTTAVENRAKLAGISVSEYIRGLFLHSNLVNLINSSFWNHDLVLEFLKASHAAIAAGAPMVNLDGRLLPVLRPYSVLTNDSFPEYQQAISHWFGPSLEKYPCSARIYSSAF